MLLIGKIVLISMSLLSLVPNYFSTRESSLLRDLNAESGNTLQIDWDENTKTPSLITGQLTNPSKHSPQWISSEFLNRIKILYSLKWVNEDMKIVKIDRSSGTVKVYMQRVLFGNEVCGDHLIITISDSGILQRIEGTIHAGLEKQRFNRPMYPAVTQKEAIQIAASYAKLSKSSEMAEVHSCYLPTRVGVPLIHVVKLNQTNNPIEVKIHSLTGRIME